MKEFFFYIFLIITSIQCQSTFNHNKFQLQPSLVYHNCQTYQQSGIIKGQDLAIGRSYTPTKYLSIKGWFFLRGIDAFDKTLISIHSSSSMVALVNLYYNSQTFKVTIDVAGEKYQKDFFVSLNQWLFLTIWLHVDKSSNNLQSILSIQRSGGQEYLQKDQILNGLNFDLDNLIFNIGSPSKELNVLPSCSISKDLRLHQNYLFRESVNNLKFETTSIDTQLYFFFEFYSIALTPGLLQSQGVMKNNVKLFNPLQDTNEFSPANKLMEIPIINLSEIGSFILTFDASIVEFLSGAQCQIISLQLINLENSSASSVLSFQFTSLNQISINSSITSLNHHFTQWTQFNLSVNILLRPQWYFWIDNNYIDISSQIIPHSVSLAQITLGPNNDKCKIKIDNVKVYRGHQIKESETCIASMGEDDKECLRCRDNYLLDQSDQKMSCVSADFNQRSEIRHVKKQIRKECPMNMYFFNSKCQCMKGFYLENETCKRCPKYCLDCVNATSCNNINYKRDSQGKCINNDFDDGFSCILPTNSFDFKEILLLQYPALSFDPECLYKTLSDGYTFKNSLLNLKETDTLFYSFFLKESKMSYSCFSFFKIGNEEIFTFLFQQIDIPTTTSTSPIYYVSILFKGTEKFKIQIQPNILFWVGVYTDLNDHIFILHSLGQTVYEKFTEKINYTTYNPSICVGPCISQHRSLDYLCSIIGSLPLLIVKGIQDPISLGVDNIFHFHSNNQQIIAKYICNEKQPLSQILDTNNNPDFTINLSIPYPIFHKIKGVGFSNENYGTITNFNTVNGFLTFQCQIQIEFIESQLLLLQYQIGMLLNVKYYLIPEEFSYYATIRICVNQYCTDAKQLKIEVQTPTSLIIFPKNKAPYEAQLKFFEFDVISNLQREKLTLVSKASYNVALQIQNIQLSENSSFKYLMFLNHLKFYQSGFFYEVDYRESESCFIYMNINPKICIYPKLGYYFYQNKVISYQECQDLNERSEYFFFANKNSLECEVTDIQIKKCKEIDFNGQTYFCQKCKDPYAILFSEPSKSFLCNECKDGFFLSSSLDRCLICHNKCSKCTKSFDNCTECAHDGQLTPSCQCIEPHYYLETDYTCQECEDKCQTCEQLKSYCITCSENRIYPPLCTCRPGYLENPTTKECEKIVCDYKCLTCIDTPSNCDVCAQNRILSPDCKCGINYSEDLNGNCQACPLSTYFDISSLSCEPCFLSCAECEDNKYKCTSCKDGFLLKENTCICQNKNVPYVSKNGEQKCLESMLMNLEIRFTNKIYSLVFIFREEIQDIDFKTFQVKEILSVYLSKVLDDAYEIINPQVNGKEFSIDIKMLKSVCTLQGSVIFYINQIFISKSEEYAMSNIYTSTNLNFEIGPFLFTEEVLVSQQLDKINQVINQINPNLLDFIQKFQFVFYILNTLQPTISFFLLNLHFPPNLYKFYQIIGSFIFSKVPNYQSHLIQQQYKIFNNLFDSFEVQPSNQFSFYGFSNCLVVNIPIILIKIGVILFGLIISMLLFDIKLIQKLISVGQQLKIKLYQKLNEEIEINLLSITLSLMIQVGDVNQKSFMNRISVYVSLILGMVVICNLIFNIFEVNQKNESQYSILFTERLQSRKGKFQKNYFILQLIKKYSVVINVFTLHCFPFYTCTLNGVIFLISSISTLLLKPYKLKSSRAIKFIGDLILSILWFFHIFLVRLEAKLFKNTIMEDEMVSQYMMVGNVVIYTLLIYNCIYLLEFIINSINQIRDKKKPPPQDKEEEKEQMLIKTRQPLFEINHSQRLFKKAYTPRYRFTENQLNK